MQYVKSIDCFRPFQNVSLICMEGSFHESSMLSLAEVGGEHAACTGSGYAEGDDLIVNLWRNRGDAVIWSVAQLEEHLQATTGSQQAFEGLWTSVQRIIGGEPESLTSCDPATAFSPG